MVELRGTPANYLQSNLDYSNIINQNLVALFKISVVSGHRYTDLAITKKIVIYMVTVPTCTVLLDGRTCISPHE